MKVAVLTTGNELLAGNIVDSNAAWISDKCWMLGHQVVRHLTVGDDPSDISDALHQLSNVADVVLVSGGLGATVDDITIETAAKAFGLKMVLDQEVWKGIQDFFDKVGRDCTGNNKKQALLPEGASPLTNCVGTAPGVQLTHENVVYFFVPGVPREMVQIFDDSILPWLKKHADRAGYHQLFLKCFGLPEATFDELISDIKLDGVDLSFRVSFPEVKIKLVARGDAAQKKVENAASQIRDRLGYHIYGTDDDLLEEVVGELLIKNGYKLAVAESCTGGLILNRLTDIAGSSRYVERGFVTYSNESKMEALGVSEDDLKKYGAVSEEVAIQMAEGALEESMADVALSVTGIAGPTGGTPEKPVGTVHIALAGPNGTMHKRYFYSRDRLAFKSLVSTMALDMIRRYLLDLETL